MTCGFGEAEINDYFKGNICYPDTLLAFLKY